VSAGIHRRHRSGIPTWTPEPGGPYTDEKKRQVRAHYSAQILQIDQQVGRILSALEESGRLDNTMVIFASDHGDMVGDHGINAKGNYYEGGIRVPSIVSWPGKIPQGEVRSEMATGCDWFPTIAEYCGAKVAKDRKLDGRSLVKVIADAKAPSPHKSFYWQLGSQAVVREGEWKLLLKPKDHNRPTDREPGGKLFLANVREDPGESKNLSKTKPDVVERLMKLQKSYSAEITQRKR